MCLRPLLLGASAPSPSFGCFGFPAPCAFPACFPVFCQLSTVLVPSQVQVPPPPRVVPLLCLTSPSTAQHRTVTRQSAKIPPWFSYLSRHSQLCAGNCPGAPPPFPFTSVPVLELSTPKPPATAQLSLTASPSLPSLLFLPSNISLLFDHLNFSCLTSSIRFLIQLTNLLFLIHNVWAQEKG